jgi:hypothetical protein
MSTQTERPWLTPDETMEALETMTRSAEVIRSVAEFGSLRKELRGKLIEQARLLDQFVQMHHRCICDESLMLGVAAMAEQKRTGVIHEMMEALEKHVSEFNRRK